MFKKIGNKIIGAYSLLFVALITALLLIFNNIVWKANLAILRREMDEKIAFIELVLTEERELHKPHNRQAIADTLVRLGRIIGLRITLIAPDGNVLADTEHTDVSTLDNHAYRAEVIGAKRTGSGESIRYSSTLRQQMLYRAKQTPFGIFRLAKSLAQIEEGMQGLRRFLVAAGAFTVAFSVLIIVFISRRIIRPVNETINFARHFSEGDYSRRILNYSDDEIGILQLALNRLADSIVEKMENLDLERRKLAITIDHIHDGIAVIDQRKRLAIANNAFHSFMRTEPGTIDRTYYETIRHSDLNARIEYALSAGVPASFETELAGGDMVEVFLTPLTGGEAIRGILVVLHDITEKKRIEQIKTDLVGNMSHELKTPVAILKGYIETILQHPADAAMTYDFLRKALANVDRQNALINDILKLNRLETTDEFPVEPISIEEIFRSCIDILSPKAQERGVTVSLSGDHPGAQLQGNRFLAEEIFFNLLDNAINYNREGGSVSVGVRRFPGFVRYAVADTGIGIPTESLGRIFERFYRVDKSRSRATGGTGLGLAIVKHAAELMRWKITVTSNERGSVFTIDIPAVNS